MWCPLHKIEELKKCMISSCDGISYIPSDNAKIVALQESGKARHFLLHLLLGLFDQPCECIPESSNFRAHVIEHA